MTLLHPLASPASLALVFLAAPGLLAQEPASGFAADVPIEQPGSWDGEGPVLVQARVRGPQGEYQARFLFDTGAGRTVLDLGFAREIGLADGLNLPLVGIGGADSAGAIAVPEIAFGDYVFSEVGVSLLDLSFLSFDPRPVHGILGSDVLGETIAELDLGAGRLRLAPAEWEMLTEGYAFEELRWFAGIPQIQIEVDGRPAWFMLDTGNTARTSLHGPYFRDNYNAAGQPRMRVHGIGGASLVWAGRIGRLQVGDRAWTDVPAFAPASRSTGGLLNSPAADGNLGMDLLRHHDLLFDYARNRIGFRAGEPRAVRPKGDPGLRLAPRGDGFEVAAVVERSGAAKARIRPGDRLVAIAGELVAGKNRTELMSALFGELGSEVKITVQSKDKAPRNTKLARKDVFPAFKLRPAETEEFAPPPEGEDEGADKSGGGR